MRPPIYNPIYACIHGYTPMHTGRVDQNLDGQALVISALLLVTCNGIYLSYAVLYVPLIWSETWLG